MVLAGNADTAGSALAARAWPENDAPSWPLRLWPILLAIALVALTGANVRNVIVAVTIGETPRVVRLMRSVVLSAREEPYAEGAITSGTRPVQILWRHILPNTMSPILVQATYIFASAMIAEAVDLAYALFDPRIRY